MLTIYGIALFNFYGDADNDNDQTALLRQNDMQGMVIEDTQ